jgi:eukaryotic-like serine/threonine-protein kinase
MTIQVGEQLGPYQITALLGKGGMGEVYRARDTRLQRDVALKFLPEAFASDHDRLVRFQREAQLLASLNHPHIAGIYGLEEARPSALVMELVDGPTLAERMAQGPIPIEDALPIARQIAEALEYAHENGIIHRDLKPANIKLTPDGRVKVLDFGLAKALNEESTSSAMSQSPTISLAATQAGIILGTAAYMSPEQAKGKIVDRRADIWAFGVVVYEMLTGRSMFTGETVSETMAQVIMKDPDWSALPASTPSRLRDLLGRCLVKDPRNRLRDIGDARIAIEEMIAHPGSSAAATTRKPAMLWKSAAAFLVIAIVFGFALGYVYRSPASSETVRFFISAPEKMAFSTGGRPATSVVISPDGHKLAFTAADTAGKIQIWLRGIDELTSRPLSGTDGANFPFWSPDSRYIGYFAHDKLMKVDAFGGPPQTLCDAPGARGGTWSRDGVIVFGTQNGPLGRVAAVGGTVTIFTKLAAGQTDHRFPAFLPDGRHILLAVNSGDAARGGIWVTSIDSGEMKRLLGANSGGIYASGYLFFVREGTLLAQPFNPSTFQLSDEPFPVAEHVEYGVYFGSLAFSVSSNGVLAYGTGMSADAGVLQLTWLDRSGKQVEVVGSPGNYLGVDLAPDGKSLAAHRHDGRLGPAVGGGDIWLLDWSRGTNSRFTFDASRDNRSPLWSPDGTRIVYEANQSGKWNLYQKASTGAGNEELLLESERPITPESWSPDGKSIVYALAAGGKTGDDLWLLPLSESRKAVPLVNGLFNQRYSQISPDGKWLAFGSDETGRFEIYVIPFPSGEGKWQISNNGGNFPRWRRDSRELFYKSVGKVFAVEITANGSKLTPGTPKELFDAGLVPLNHPGGGPYHSYAVSNDGQRFLVTQPVSPVVSDPAASPIAVVLNWTSAIKK